ncbi:MAG TPA: shikimate dehydrogenase, partial [Chromatiaceae bacterium]|nr:shikimate dehydrogenase [Chromatiaceae bacterium]
MSDRYAVIGNPIEHSKSPRIHRAFAEQTGEELVYERLLGDPARFAEDIQNFLDSGGRGLNVTVPFKEEALQLVDELTPRARAAGAVNTLALQPDGTLLGDNTDGVGLVRDLADNQGFDFHGKRILLLGAGGVARGVVRPLLEQEPDLLVIANRTAAKARQLAQELKDGRVEVRGVGLDELKGQPFDLIINATAAGLEGKVPAIPLECLATGGWIYDMMYGNEPTAFVRWGQRHGAARALDGLGMLVEQAAESFRIWRGVSPATEAVI